MDNITAVLVVCLTVIAGLAIIAGLIGYVIMRAFENITLNGAQAATWHADSEERMGRTVQIMRDMVVGMTQTNDAAQVQMVDRVVEGFNPTMPQVLQENGDRPGVQGNIDPKLVDMLLDRSDWTDGRVVDIGGRTGIEAVPAGGLDGGVPGIGDNAMEPGIVMNDHDMGGEEYGVPD